MRLATQSNIFFPGPSHEGIFERFAHRNWRPAVDVYQTEKGWLIKLDLAGVRLPEIRVSVRGREINVAGIRKDWLISRAHQAQSMEIAYSRFERTVQLPCEVEGAVIEKEYRDGMLILTVQKEEPR